jgi:hypothetical protein
LGGGCALYGIDVVHAQVTAQDIVVHIQLAIAVPVLTHTIPR